MGFPSVAQDYFISDFSFDENVITHPETTFVLRASGEGWAAEGVHDGDLLLIDRSLAAQPGDLAVLVIDGDLVLGRPADLSDQSHYRAEAVGHSRPVAPYLSQQAGSSSAEPNGSPVVWGVLLGSYHPRHKLVET